jgi:hypothetical protein
MAQDYCFGRKAVPVAPSPRRVPPGRYQELVGSARNHWGMLYDVSLRFVSAVLLPSDQAMRLNASPDSTFPIHSITYLSEYGEEGRGELICHVRGEVDDLDKAVDQLGNSGIKNLQLLALAGNAAILSPHLICGYEPRPGGRFRVHSSLGHDPHASRRTVDPERAIKLIQAVHEHPEGARLYRAAENYGETLRRIFPSSYLQAANHAWIAVECLTQVIERRLKKKHGTSDLAAVLGVEPRKSGEPADPRDVRGALRKAEVFDGDKKAYKDLRDASDGIEHGFMSFGEARELVDSEFPRIAGHVRRSILREAGLSESEVTFLTTGEFEKPLPLWRPSVVADGRFQDETEFDFDVSPAHIRVDSTIKATKIRADEHATDTELKANLTSHDGLDIQVSSVGLSAPGTMEIALDEDEGS